MRLIAYAGPDGPRFGALENEFVRDVGPVLTDPAPGAIVGRPSDLDLLPPVGRPGKIVCVGLNYRDHAIESNLAVPEIPMIFAKFGSSLLKPGTPIVIPSISNEIDFEAELGVIIGRTAKAVPVANALDYVFGYTCVNDVSARDLQRVDGQFIRAKSIDTFCPTGPAVVTSDEVPDPQALGIRCLVNETTMQDSSTSDMVFSVATIIAFISQAISLEPGDLIATGTPAGIGNAREPKVFLRAGDTVSVEIDTIGALTTAVVDQESEITCE
jgi:2-keto-4-pentenoate hydratase/2-oxohepta-3-ene-1,7-dioic acid hydratase in catechol pathway